MKIAYPLSLAILYNMSLLISASLPSPALAVEASELAASQCKSCHGPQGNSDKKEIPSIAGLSREYLLDSMNDFKSRKRLGEKYQPPGEKETDMNEIMNSLSGKEMKSLAQFFSQQVFIPRKQAYDEKLAKKGKKVYLKRCERCHDDNGRAADDDMGRLAGQSMEYLQEQLKNFISAKRKPPKKMAKQLKRLKPNDIPALIHFFAAQQT